MADDSPPAYDEIAAEYARVVDPDGAGVIDPVLVELAGDVEGHTVLSLACGQGADARLFAARGAAVTGIDVSSQMLGRARSLEKASPLGVAYVQGDAQDLAPLGDASFDGVVCRMALMDIPQLAPTIRAVARVLRDGGWFVFSIVHPCFAGHVASVTDYMAEHRYDKDVSVEWLPPHAYHRPLEMYVETLVSCGFRLERLEEVHHAAADQSGVPALLYARAVLSRHERT